MSAEDGYPCPAEGCDYVGASKEAAKGHWGGKQDDVHSGAWHAAYADAQEADEGNGDGPDPASGSEGSGDPSQGDPTMGSRDPDGDEDDQEDVHDLPCGHESFDAAEAPDPPFVVQCDSCSGTWEVTEL